MNRKLALATAIVGAALAFPSGSSAAPFAYVVSGGAACSALPQHGCVSQFDIGAGGLLAPLSPFAVPAGDNPNDVDVSPDAKSAYVTNAGHLTGDPDDVQASVSQYDISGSGRLSPKSPPEVTSCGSTVSDLAVSPNGKSAYVPTGGDCDRVYQFDIGADGGLSPKHPAFVESVNPVKVMVSPDSRSVYVTNASFLGRVYEFDANAGGQLSPKNPPSVAAGHSPLGIAVTPDGQSVYVVNNNYNGVPGSHGTISQYDVSPTGTLTPKSPSTVAAGGQPVNIAVTPDGKSAYVPNPATDNISQYDIDPVTGTLSPKVPRTVAAGNSPSGIGVTPDGKSVYITQSGGIAQYDVGAGGRLSPKSPASVTGNFGGAVAVTPVPTSKAQCRHGDWRRFGFKNQGQCIRSVKHGPK